MPGSRPTACPAWRIRTNKGSLAMKTILAWAMVALTGGLCPTVAAAQSAKPVVAVVRIDDLTRSGQAQNLTAMIESAIAGTGRFRLMERERIGALMGEQARARGGTVTTNTPGRVGGFEGVDYLVYGTITSLSARAGSDAAGNLIHGLLGNRNPGCNERATTLALDIKITDTDTGEIRYIKRLDETQTSSSCGSAAQTDATVLLRSAAQKIATGLVTSIWPMQVAAVAPDGGVVLNYGEGTVAPGQVMMLYAKGQEIRDPATGDVLDVETTPLGLIKIASVSARTSRGQAASAFAVGVPVGALARLASKEEVRAMSRRK